ncbi:hypothetical protein DPSP01_014253 [Paraphaeosphaeria sporulosa]|uniref:N-acetyltransferase domain-containing protein n=1 Tax=Paraphaeosphaeria sporulosa TaxID=1460663 RepID=A0A177BV10_9PLEO|nr:uncharacterized protein CC84DRAFT_429658 [Paraphaeosphaeria sporulosa]OAF98561.1 hypothetical protein CC84DRAFT_429658 [Paraphaeosphaeria sporulosa]
MRPQTQCQVSHYLQTPWILLTERLVIVPTPMAVRCDAYIQLYSALHASEAFCTMAFGPDWGVRNWTDEETRDVIITRDMERCWKTRGMGDFAVGMRTDDHGTDIVAGQSGRCLNAEGTANLVRISDLDLGFLDRVKWAGYAGVRDATTTSMPEREAGDEPLPPWEEMVELRYGVHEKVWGKGVAAEAARAVMLWAMAERGVRRFIAETEKTNGRSGRVLQKMGFRENGTDYWKEPGETEWEKVAL